MCSVSAMSAVPSAADGVVGGFDGGVRAVRAALAVLAGQQIDAAEEEVLELAVQPVEMDARPEDLRVALGERARRADLAALGGVVHQELRLVDLLLQAPVHAVQVRAAPRGSRGSRDSPCGVADPASPGLCPARRTSRLTRVAEDLRDTGPSFFRSQGSRQPYATERPAGGVSQRSRWPAVRRPGCAPRSGRYGRGTGPRRR